jgi:hypothetical protein
MACGQSEGSIDGHVEDYGREPDGTHAETKRVGMCFRCHMMIHSRLRYPRAWDEYRNKIRAGYRGPPFFYRSYHQVIRENVEGIGIAWVEGAPPSRQILDEIHRGDLCPAGRVAGNG